MRRVFSVVTVVAVALAFVAVGMGVGPVAADAGNESDDQLEDETNGTDAADGGEVVDDQVRITDWEFTGSEFVIELEAESSRTITATPSQHMSEGASQVTWVTEPIPAGTSTVTVPAETIGGEAAVVISTPQSRQDHRAVQLSTGNPEDNPFQYFGGESGLFAGVGLSIVTSAGAAGFVLWRENDGVIRA